MAPKHGSLWAVLLHTLAFVADGQSCAELPEASSLRAPEYSASRSSCLVQRRVDDKKTESNAFGSPFSLQQQQCIAEYVSKVRTILPDYNLTGRRFGGKIGGSKPQHPPILGAGFGSTATRSLTAFGQQLGLKVHHYFPKADKRWQFLDDLLTANCTSRAQLDETDFQGLIESGHQMLLDTPMAELFLDFYSVSPESKVILTLRPAQSWAENRRKNHPDTAWPLQSPCERRVADLSVQDAVKLFDWHTTLVRCIVPSENLLEVDPFNSLVDSMRVAKFLGAPTDHYVPFPHVGKEVDQSSLHEKAEASSKTSGSG